MLTITKQREEKGPITEYTRIIEEILKMNINHPLTPERSLTHSPKASNKTVNSKKVYNSHHQSYHNHASGHVPNSENSDLLDPEMDEDDTVVELLRCESSPIYASRPSSTLGKKTGAGLHSPSSPLLDPIGFWVDVERNLRMMDKQNEANFTDWIKNEHNLTLSLPHLKRIMFDYGIDRIINGLKWLIYEWRLASIATAIKYLLIDDIWNPKHDPSEFDFAHYLNVAGHCYTITKTDFRNRIRIIMALIDGWNFEHVRELFHFLCTASCPSTSQSTFLLQALLLAFPEGSYHARQLKRQLIESFLFN